MAWIDAWIEKVSAATVALSCLLILVSFSTLSYLAETGKDEGSRLFCWEGIPQSSLKIGSSLQPVACDGSWLIIQQRGQFGQNTTNFRDKEMAEYKRGFGNTSQEFWLGLENLALITGQGEWQLRVDMQDWYEKEYTAMYESFSVGPAPLYKLHVSGYSNNSTAGDSLTIGREENGWYHNGMAFSTKDVDNDRWLSGNCAEKHGGGWWFNNCHAANLNGRNYGRKWGGWNGVVWYHGGTRGNTSQSWRGARMSIRTKGDHNHHL